jgi:hypothetical protein
MAIPKAVQKYDEKRVLKHIESFFRRRDRFEFAEAAEDVLAATPGSNELAAGVLLASLDPNAIKRRLKDFSGVAKDCLSLALFAGLGGLNSLEFVSSPEDFAIRGPLVFGIAAAMVKFAVDNSEGKEKEKRKRKLGWFLQVARQASQILLYAPPHLILLHVYQEVDDREALRIVYDKLVKRKELHPLLLSAAETYSRYLEEKGADSEALKARESAEVLVKPQGSLSALRWSVESARLALKTRETPLAAEHFRRIEGIVQARIETLTKSVKEGAIQKIIGLGPIAGLADCFEFMRQNDHAEFVKKAAHDALLLCGVLDTGNTPSRVDVEKLLEASGSPVAWGAEEGVLQELVGIVECYRLVSPGQDRILFEKQRRLAQLCFDKRTFHIVSARLQLYEMRGESRSERMTHLKTALDHFALAYRWWQNKEAYGCFGVWGALLHYERAKERFDTKDMRGTFKALDQAKGLVKAARKVYGDSEIVKILDNGVAAIESAAEHYRDSEKPIISKEHMIHVEDRISQACETVLWRQVAAKHPVAFEALKPSMEAIREIPKMLKATQEALIKCRAVPKSVRRRENILACVGGLSLLASLWAIATVGPLGWLQLTGSIILLIVAIALLLPLFIRLIRS